MIGQTLGNATLSSIPATGLVANVYLTQSSVAGVDAAWNYIGDDDTYNIYFLVYLNGRLAQRLPGSSRDTEIVLTNFEAQEIEIVPWRKDITIEEDNYGSLYARRGHLEWDRPADPEIVSYRIYTSASEGGVYELLDTHDIVSLERGFTSLGVGDATLEVNGNYNALEGHTNTLFTVSATDNIATITNDKDATVIEAPFVPGVAFTPISGIVLTISGTEPISGTATFLVGVQPYYDTSSLNDGTTWFKVSVVDASGNESALSSAIPVSINLPPAPPTEAEVYLTYDSFTTLWTLWIRGVQSSSADAVEVRIYSNYDRSTNTLLDDIIMDTPYLTSSSTTSQNIILWEPMGVSRPAGTYKFIMRAVDSSGIDDGNSEVFSVVWPYVADVPQPHSVQVTLTAGGGATIAWYTNDPLPDTCFWRIDGDITNFDTTPIEPTEAGIFFRYEAVLAPSDIGPQGTYTVSIYGVDAALEHGPKTEVTFTTDATAPAVVSNLRGVPF